MHGRTCALGLLGAIVLLAGCQSSHDVKLGNNHPGKIPPKCQLTEIEYPQAAICPNPTVNGAIAPRMLHDLPPRPEDYWDLGLEEAIQITLMNSKVMRDLGGRVLRTPELAPTVYDPALQESTPDGPTRGVEAALSDFDASFAATSFWYNNDRPVNFFLPGFTVPIQRQHIGDFQAALNKPTATGGSFQVRNNTYYEWNNNTVNRFPSYWNTNFEAVFSHPLLRGAGLEYNRIAGPNGQPGNINGVLIARINQDIALADFESQVRNLVSQVEDAYWDLYYAYRVLDTAIAGRDRALQTWRAINAKFQVGSADGTPDVEANALEQYYTFQVAVETALNGVRIPAAAGATFQPGIFSREATLRLMLGLPPNDGRLIRPSDEPSLVRVSFDWDQTLQDALVQRVELRRQRWTIKRRELELVASRNFLLPRLDASGIYRWRGFGDDLLGYNNAAQFDNAFQTLFDGNYQEWQLGLTMQMPIGFRLAHTSVRNAELQLSRARAIYQQQELTVLHDLSASVREVELQHQLAQTNFNRFAAATKKYNVIKDNYESGRGKGNVYLNLLLESQRQVAQSEAAFYQSLTAYVLAIKSVHFEKGTLLAYNGIELTEGPWPREAYEDARALARHFAPRRIDYGSIRPSTFSHGRYVERIAPPIGGQLLGAPEEVAAPPESAPGNLPGEQPLPPPPPLPPAPGQAGPGLAPPANNAEVKRLPWLGPTNRAAQEIQDPFAPGPSASGSGAAPVSSPTAAWPTGDMQSPQPEAPRPVRLAIPEGSSTNRAVSAPASRAPAVSAPAANVPVEPVAGPASRGEAPPPPSRAESIRLTIPTGGANP